MAQKKTIAIAGVTGRKQTIIAKKLSQANYRVLIIAKPGDPLLTGDAEQRMPGNDIEVIACAKDGCWEADIIVLAIPGHDMQEIAGKIQEVATQKIVASVTVVKDASRISSGINTQLVKLFPYSKVISVFNVPGSTEVFVTGNDQEALREFSDIIKTAGFDPVNFISLEELADNGVASA